MVGWIIQWTIVSLVLIMLIHHLYIFFKTTLTVPKIKDLVDKPSQQYKDIMDTIKTPDSTTESKSVQKEMKNELKNYLSGLNKNNSTELQSANTNSSFYTNV